MKRVWLLGSVLLLLLVGWVVGPAGASTGGAPQTQPPASPTLSTTLFKTFSSKSGGGTTVRISADGNLIGFESPTGLDHIDAGIVAESYVLCYTNPNNAVKVNAYDVASTASGFGPSTDIASPVSVTRTTSDGILRLAQTFKFNGAGRSLQVTMTLTNISGLTVTGIGLRRQVDIDADAGGANGTGNFNNLRGDLLVGLRVQGLRRRPDHRSG